MFVLLDARLQTDTPKEEKKLTILWFDGEGERHTVGEGGARGTVATLGGISALFVHLGQPKLLLLQPVLDQKDLGHREALLTLEHFCTKHSFFWSFVHDHTPRRRSYNTQVSPAKNSSVLKLKTPALNM